MIQLFTIEGCPYCAKVLRVLDELDLKFSQIDAPHGSKNREKLLELGGEDQVPFLYIAEKDVAMYESDEIIEYLRHEYTEK